MTIPHRLLTRTSTLGLGLLLGLALGETAWAATTISAGDASVTEGDSGTTTLNIPVTRTGSTAGAISLEYETNGSPTDPATADGDYVSIGAGHAVIPPGAAGLALPVIINGDTEVEPDENLFVYVTAALNIGPEPNFAAAVAFGAGATPSAVAVADFNGDGRADVAVANGNDLAVLLSTTAAGAASPAFAVAQGFAAGANPVAVATGDFNRDGRPDLAAANASGDSVSVLLNATAPGAASPSFTPVQVFAAGAGPAAVAVTDLDGDGLPDLVVANRNSGTVSALRNTTSPGASTPAFAAASSFPAGAGPVAVAAGDLNGDGRPDLALANQNSGTVSVLLNAAAPGGTPAFAGAGSFAAGVFPSGIAIGDVNGDGQPDLAVANNLGDDVSVLLNATSPGAAVPAFAAAASTPAGDAPQAVALSDINGDGRPDLTVVNGAGAAVLINATAPGAGAARFVDAMAFAAGSSPVAVAVADLNGDGKADLAIANSASANISVLLSVSDSDGAAQTFAVGSNPTSVAMTDLNGDGRPDLAVANISDNSVSVLLNTTTAAVPVFAARQDFAVGVTPVSVAAADVNGDGKPDLAVADLGSDTTISVLLNTTATAASAASFAPLATFTSGKQPRAIAFGDFNGDGKPDLAVANFFDQSVSVLLNATADGAAAPDFAGKQDFPSGGASLGIAVGDINGDGRLDLALAGLNINGQGAAVLLNTTAAGASTASFAAVVNFTVGAGSRSVAFGDFNGDSKPDLAVANADSDTVSVLRNTTVVNAATPSFAAKQDFTGGASPLAVAAADLDADGRPDLALTNANSNNVSVFLNTTVAGAATASFTARQDSTTGSAPAAVAAGDVNGDSLVDLVVANQSSNSVSVLPNALLAGSAPPVFAAAANAAAGTGPVSVALGDLNGDGRDDIAAANVSSHDVSVMFNATAPGAAAPSFAAAVNFAAGTNPRQVVRVDVNGDGKPDLVVANQTSGNASVLLNTTPTGAATPSFTASSFGTGAANRSLALGDLNGDGKPDLVAANFGAAFGANVAVRFNTTAPGGAPSFAAGIATGAGDGPLSVALGDVNGDGKPDLAVAYYYSNYVAVLLNTTAAGAGTASFAAASTFAVGTGPFAVALGDLNGDGRPDLVAANADSSNVSVRLNITAAGDGTASFGAVRNIAAGSGPVAVAVGDLNGDGRPDLAVANTNSANVSVLHNTTPAGGGSPSFAAARDFATGAGAGGVALGDLNGDGAADLAVANPGSTTVSVLFNTARSVTLADNEGTGTILDDDVADGTPDPYSFTDQTDVALGAPVTSNAITVAGINTSATISVGGGAYSIGCTALFTTTDGSIGNGDTVCVKHTSSATPATTVNTTLTIGGVDDTFSSTTEAADTTPFAFAFADAGNVAVGSAQESNAVTIAGINSAAPVSVSGGEYSKNGGAYTASAGTAGNGDSITVRHTASLLFATATDTTLTVGGVSDTFTSTTEAQDTTPDAFTFTDQMGAALGSVRESNTITVAGTNSPAAISVAGGEYSKNGGAYTSTAGTVETDNTVQVRHTASGTPATTVDTTLAIGGVADTFSSTTVPADTTPDAFTFTDQTGVGRNATVTSDTITVAGINTAAPISVSGGSYSVGCTASFTSSAGSIGNGQTVCVQHSAASGFSATVNTTLTIGGVADIFTSTTLAQDLQPNAFAFTDAVNVPLGSEQTSDAIAISGINDASDISVSGGTYSVGCTASFTASDGTIANGQTVCVRHTAASADNTGVATTLSIGGVTDIYTSTTGDATPSGFAFTAQSGVERSTVVTSNAITVGGITVPSTISISGGEYSVDSAAFTAAAGSVSNGQTVAVRHTSAAGFSTMTTTTLTIGGVAGTFTSTTAAAPPSSGGGGGGGAFGLSLLAGLAGLLGLRRSRFQASSGRSRREPDHHRPEKAAG